MFRAATVPGLPLLQSVPLGRNRAPLSGPLAPLWSSTVVRRRTRLGLVTRRFPDIRARSRGSLVPRPARSSLSTRRSAPPGRSGPRRAKPPRSAGFTHFEALFLRRVRSRRPELPRSRRPLLSWSSSPLKPSPPTPGTRDPPAAAAVGAAVPPPLGGGGARREGPRSPSVRWTTERNRSTLGNPSTASGPLRDRPGPPLGGRPPPMALDSERTRSPDLRSLSVRGRRHLLRRGACSCEVSRLLVSLVVSRTWPALAHEFTGKIRRPSPVASSPLRACPTPSSQGGPRRCRFGCRLGTAPRLTGGRIRLSPPGRKPAPRVASGPPRWRVAARSRTRAATRDPAAVGGVESVGGAAPVAVDNFLPDFHWTTSRRCDGGAVARSTAGSPDHQQLAGAVLGGVGSRASASVGA